MAAVTASTMHGVKAKRITPNDNLRRVAGSKPRPARARITVSAIALYMKYQQQHQRVILTLYEKYITMQNNLQSCGLRPSVLS